MGKFRKVQALIGITPELCWFITEIFFGCLGIGDHLGLDDLGPRAVIDSLSGGRHSSPFLVLHVVRHPPLECLWGRGAP